jgi:predicted RNA binding protein YcfA (HicA-like mRNA interferase family)
MPRKVRELMRDLEKAGFVARGGKGSHRKYKHPTTKSVVLLSGRPGDDARAYQAKKVLLAIQKVQHG